MGVINKKKVSVTVLMANIPDLKNQVSKIYNGNIVLSIILGT